MARHQHTFAVLDDAPPQAHPQPNRLQLLERRLERVERLLERHAEVWLTTRQAMDLIPCKSLKATYAWLASRGIKRAGDGTLAKSDILRVKRQPRARRVMAAASVRNLRKARG